MRATIERELHERPAEGPRQQYTEDLLAQARLASRSVRKAEDHLLHTITHDDDPDALGNYQAVVDDLYAVLFPALLTRARQVESALAGLYTDVFAHMELDAADRLMRPIFEEAGILDDFMPAAERFPAKDGAR